MAGQPGDRAVLRPCSTVQIAGFHLPIEMRNSKQYNPIVFLRVPVTIYLQLSIDLSWNKPFYYINYSSHFLTILDVKDLSRLEEIAVFQDKMFSHHGT